MNINFLRYSKIYYIFSGLLALFAIFSICFFGLKFGIDFLGGSILEIDFENRPENKIIQEKLADLNLGEIVVQPTGNNGVILRMVEISEETHQEIVSKLQEISPVQEKRFETVGPSIGRELRNKTIILIIASLIALLIYITIAFRRVSKPLFSWQYGIISIIALLFDILIPIGLLALLGKLYNVQFNIPIITALLTILGYTINDKVIIFDRVRENLPKSDLDFTGTVNHSINQTITRSINTALTTLLVLLSITLFGGSTIRYFALALFVGIGIGTYSSIFLASPLLVWFEKLKK